MAQLGVDIVLSTFNGARFLEAQLQSLRRQSHSDWRLWVRDDGSQDSTVEILEKFMALDSRIRWSTSRSSPQNLGATQSFQQLLAALPEASEVFLLCDQDDVWEDNKIETLLSLYTEQKRPELPTLIFSDLSLIDSEARPLSPSQMSHMGFFAREKLGPLKLAAQNVVTGCTVLGNRALLKMALPIPAPALMHDWWLALVAECCGQVLFCPRPLVKYRQHQSNASGGSRKKGAGEALRLLARGGESFVSLMEQRFRQLRALRDHLRSRGIVLSPLNSVLESTRLGRWGRVREALSQGFLPQGLERQLLFLLLLVIWRPGPQDIHRQRS